MSWTEMICLLVAWHIVMAITVLSRPVIVPKRDLSYQFEQRWPDWPSSSNIEDRTRRR
jgi:hypothetical protein